MVCSARSRSHGFNEAPIHESGKSGQRAAAGGTCQGFNEAPIHESGKSLQLYTATACVDSFNEAPIHESGKCCILLYPVQVGLELQ